MKEEGILLSILLVRIAAFAKSVHAGGRKTRRSLSTKQRAGSRKGGDKEKGETSHGPTAAEMLPYSQRKALPGSIRVYQGEREGTHHR